MAVEAGAGRADGDRGLVDRMVADAELAPLVLLHDRYEVLDALDDAVATQVVRGWDHQQQRAVAIKVRRPIDDREREAIIEEAEALLSVRPSRNLPAVRDAFVERDDHHLVTDWVTGEDLRDWMRRDGSPGLPFAVVLPALQDLAAALDLLHAQEPPLAHGDVRPDNIVMFRGSGDRAIGVLVGLGSIGSVTDPEATPYQSPEVAAGAPTSPAADVYALAATAFELITGRVPLAGATLDWSGVPPEALDAVRHGLARGLAHDRRTRPTSATELIVAVGEGASVTRGWFRRRTTLDASTSGPRRGLRRALLAVGLVAVAAVAVGITWQVVDEDDPPPPAEAPISGPTLFPPEQLPAGSAHLGRIGILDPKELTDGGAGGVFESYDLGEDGATALRGGQIGTTQTYSQMVQLTDDTFLWYRKVDAYAIVVRWNDDGSLPIVFTPLTIGGGWTEIERIGSDLLFAYDAETGRAEVVRFDDAGTIGEPRAVAGLRAGWSKAVAAGEDRVALYDASTGETQVLRVADDGAFTVDGHASLDSGWTTAVPVRDGVVVFGDGTSGQLRAVDLSAATPSQGAAVSAAPWTASVSPAEGWFLLYLRADGSSRLGRVEGITIVLGPEVRLPIGGGKLVSRP